MSYSKRNFHLRASNDPGTMFNWSYGAFEGVRDTKNGYFVHFMGEFLLKRYILYMAEKIAPDFKMEATNTYGIQ